MCSYDNIALRLRSTGWERQAVAGACQVAGRSSWGDMLCEPQ